MEATRTKRFYCGHCDQEVSRTTLYAHKRLYYNRTTREWSKVRVSYPATDVHPIASRNDLEETVEDSGSNSENCNSDHDTQEIEDGGATRTTSSLQLIYVHVHVIQCVCHPLPHDVQSILGSHFVEQANPNTEETTTVLEVSCMR